MEAFFGPGKGRRIFDLAHGYLLYERNQTFAETARPLFDQGGTVIAVGAYHLPGEQGLVTMFRNLGFQVERVPVAGEVPD